MSIHNTLGNKAEAFQKRYEQHHERLRASLAARFHDRDMAEDVAASAFATAFENAEHFRGESSFYTWLFAIALNNTRRQMAQRRTVSLEALSNGQRDVVYDSDPMSAPLEQAERRAMLHSAIRRVPPAARRMLIDHVVRGHAIKKIAHDRRIPLGTALSRVHRAKNLLRAAWGV